MSVSAKNAKYNKGDFLKKTKFILLFGMPRSGTTWIGKLFDSHADSYYLHEPDSVEPNYNVPLLLSSVSTFEPEIINDLDNWLKPTAEKVIASRPFFKKSYLNFYQYGAFVTSAYIAKLSAKLDLPFLRKPFRPKSTPPVIVWKSIESLGRMSVYQNQLDAYSIQIIRHPCGQIASTIRGEELQKFEGSIPTYEDWDLFEKLIVQSGEQRYTLIDIKNMIPEERLALRWGLINDFALNHLDSKKSAVLIYEDLCRDPEEVVRKIFAKIGIGINAETERYIKESTTGNDDSYYATTKSPLDSAYKWRSFLSKETQQKIANILKNFESGKLYENDY